MHSQPPILKLLLVNSFLSLRSLQWGLLAPWHFLARERLKL
jgi:hypothetical protein